VFRGITVAGMLLVNNPGSWNAIYEPLEHAPWFGWTPTDLIFPFFLFIVGVTTYLSREARRARGESDGAIMRQTARRALTIIATRAPDDRLPVSSVLRASPRRRGVRTRPPRRLMSRTGA